MYKTINVILTLALDTSCMFFPLNGNFFRVYISKIIIVYSLIGPSPAIIYLPSGALFFFLSSLIAKFILPSNYEESLCLSHAAAGLLLLSNE